MNDQHAPLIRIAGVTKRYGDRTILDAINLDVLEGQTVALIGPSGGGKSTLLRCINGLATWDEGSVSVDGHTMEARMPAGEARDVKRRVRRIAGMIFQDFALFPHLTVLANVIESPTRVLGLDRKAAVQRGMQLLDRVGLADRVNHYPDQLSGGQKQRVAIARALAMSPRVLLCDEITSALDPELKHEVLEVVHGLRQEGMTLILVTHEMGFARRAADRVLLLSGGRIIEDGPPSTVFDAPTTERAQRFLSRVADVG